MEAKDWVPIALGLVQTIYAGATYHRDRLQILSRPMLLMATFTALTWGAVLFDFTHKPAQPPGTIADYGVTNSTFYAKAIVPSWSDFKSYRAMLITRSNFANVDRPSDTYLGKSPLYTVEGPQITLAVSAGDPAMRYIPGPNDVEFNLVLLPAGVTREDIRTIGDIPRYRGLTVDVRYLGGVTAGPTPAK